MEGLRGLLLVLVRDVDVEARLLRELGLAHGILALVLDLCV